MLENCTFEEATERVQKYVNKNNPTYIMKSYDNCGDKHFDVGFFNKYFIWCVKNTRDFSHGMN